MKNLIDEYFKRDLSESEEQQLSEWLSSHPEDAERLANGMSDLYLKSGLPEPVWPGGNPPFGRSKWWILKPLMPLLLAFLLLGVGAYKWVCSLPSTADEPTTSSLPHPSQSLGEKLKAVAKAVRPIVKAAPKTVPEVKANPIAPAPVLSTAPNTSLPKPVAPQTARPQGHVYQQLSVAVAQATPGLVTVKVRDNLNTEVRTLFAGILPQGNQTFTWDGKTEIGAVAPPGTYFIEVKSGQTVQRKEVNIEGPALP